MAHELERIEARRQALVLPVSMLADRAGLELRQLQRIRAGGRAWPREIRALKMALRSIERERRSDEALFPGD
jgi:hypothetical protein